MYFAKFDNKGFKLDFWNWLNDNLYNIGDLSK